MLDEWYLSTVCESFHCDLLTAAEQPVGLTTRVLELRSYAHAYHAVQNAKREGDVERTPMVDLVLEIESAVVKDRKAEADRRLAEKKQKRQR